MAKNEKFKPNDFSLDSGLDFDNFDIGNIDSQFTSEARKPKSRSPVSEVFRGTISGAADRFKSPSFLASLTRKALPDSYGVAIDTADKALSTATSLYDDAVKEVKPQASRLARKIDRLVPDERKTIKSFTSKIAKVFGGEETQAISKEAQQDQSIQLGLASIFDQQQAVQNEKDARTSARDSITDSIERKEFRTNLGVLASIDNNIARMQAYNERVNQAVQRKSLELQYRSYFALADMATTNRQYFEVFKVQHEAIARNTSLPEFVKIKNSERFKDLARTKFIDKIQTSFFGEGSAIDRGLKRIGQDLKQYVGGLKSGLEAAGASADNLAMMQEMNRELAELGIAPPSAAHMAGSILGGSLVNKAGEKFGAFARKHTEKIKPIRDLGNKLGNIALNPTGALNEWRNSDKYKERLAKGGTLATAGDKFLNYFSDHEPDKTVNNPFGITAPNSASVFNSMTQRSITDIIPGYLARILREVTVTRTGDKKTGLLYFNQQSGKFVEKKQIGETLRKAVSEKIKSPMYAMAAMEGVQHFTKGEEVDKDQTAKISNFLAKISTIPNMAFTPENVMKTNAFKSLDPDTQKLVKMIFDKKITNNEDPLQGQREFTGKIAKLRDNTPDPMPTIELLIHNGFGEALENEGLVTRNEKGDYVLDEDKYYALLRKENIVTSDRNKKTDVKPVKKGGRFVTSDVDAKENIHPLHPKRALNAIRKTGIFDWTYKKGRGDTDPHRGPMAQDVLKNMGSEAAPGGTKLDLTSMNGNNMAAIQELADRQDKHDERHPVTLKLIQGISDNVTAIRELLEKGGGGFGGGNGEGGAGAKFRSGSGYKDLLGNLFTAGSGILGQASSDITKAAKQVFGFTKDNIAKPLGDKAKDLYAKHKDPLMDGLKRLMGKAGEMASKALEVGQDVVFNQLPKAWSQAAVLGGKLKDKIKGFINQARDVYIPGRVEPALRATLIRAGYYRDKVTGKVITSMDDLANLKGDIVDQTGEVVLSIKDAANGLYDQYGERVKTTLSKIAGAVMNYAAEGWERAKAFWGSALEHGKHLAGRAGNAIKNKIPGFGMGGERIYQVLVEIRGILRNEETPRHEEVIKKNKQKKDGEGFVGPKQPVATRLKKKGMEILGKIKDKASDAKDKIQEKLNGGAATTTTEETVEGGGGSELPGLEKPQAKYGAGGGGLVDGLMSMGSKVPGLLAGAKGKLGSIKDAVKGASGVKGKAGAALSVLGGFFGGGGDDAAKAQAEAAEEHRKAEERMGPPKPEPEKPEGSEGLLHHAKNFIKKKVTRIGDKFNNAKQAFNDRDGNGRRDGSWEDRLDAQAQADKERKAALPGLQAAQAKYVSEKDIFKSISEKVSGAFKFLTSGLGDIFNLGKGLFGKAGKLLGMGGEGGLFGSAKSLLGKMFGMGGKAAGVAGEVAGAAGAAEGVAGAAAKTAGTGILSKLGTVAKFGGKLLGGAGVAYGAYDTYQNLKEGNYGSAAVSGALTAAGAVATFGGGSAILGGIGTAIGAIASVISLPVILGAAAIAAVGYGAYKLYKYATRDNVDMFERIRMYQYGLNQSDDVSKKHNHEMIALEDYLLDARYGYRQGQAYLLEKKIDPQDLLDIFSIDKSDEDMTSKFMIWFNNRFKPFFLTSITALFSVNPKTKLRDIDSKLTNEEKIKYLGLIGFESGPYALPTSPFKDMNKLWDTAVATKADIDNATKKVKADIDKKAKKTDSVDKNKVAAAAAVPAAAAGAAASSATKPDTPKPTVPVVPPKTDGQKMAQDIIDKNKDLNAAISGDANKAEDGPLKEEKATGEKGPVDTAINEGPSVTPKLYQAAGPVRDGKNGMQFMKLNPGVKIDSMNPAMREMFLGMIQEYGETTGKSVTVTSGTRTTEEQAALFKKNPKKAAPPGHSMHEFGLAVDVNSGDLDELEKLGLMRKYGFTRPVGGEPWHTESAGIQINLDKAKKDSDFASTAIGAALFKGGSGVGSIRGTPLGKRDSMFAINVMKDKATTVAAADKAAAPSDKDKVQAAVGAPPTTVAAATTVSMPDQPKATKPDVQGPSSSTAAMPISQISAANDPSAKNATSMLAGYQQADKYSKSASMPDLETETKAKADANSAVVDTSGAGGDVKAQIADVARKQNVNPNDMLTFAAVESSLDPNASAGSGGSAQGLYGYTKTTWDYQLQKDRSKLNLSDNPSPRNVSDSTMMASEYYKTNKRFLQGVKPNPTITDVYLAHFLGPSGARKFLTADPNAIAAEVVPNQAAQPGNRPYFYEGNRALTVAEVYRKIDTKLSKKAKEFGINFSGGGGDLPARTPAQRVQSQPPVSASASYSTARTPSDVIASNTDQQPYQPPPPPVRQPIRMPQPPQMAAVQPDRFSGGQTMGTPVDMQSNINTTLVQSLAVQKEALGVLKNIMANTDPQALAAILKGTSQPAQSGPAPGQQRTGAQQAKDNPTSVIDLKRQA